MNVLCIEKSADGLLDLALRAQDAGHHVRYFLSSFDERKCPVGKGLVERVGDWRSSMVWADLVLVGGNGSWMRELESWKARGVPVIGCGGEAEKWELDRIAGMKAFKEGGVLVAPYTQVKSYAEALAYVARRDEGFAIKPSGDVADKSLSVVEKTGRAMVDRLERLRKAGKVFPNGFIIQDRIEGVETAVGAWIGPGGFAEGWEENFEEKRLFAGALGPNCGEAGTVMRLVRSSKLAKKVLAPFEDRLVTMGYVGNVDVNTIIDQDGNPWPLEWTMRFGYPAINIELALHHGDPIEFLAGVAAGRPPRSRTMNEIAVGVVLALPPYPFGHEKTEEVIDIPIWGVTDGIKDALHFCEVEQGTAPRIENDRVVREVHLATAGSYVMVGTGTGESVTAARKGAYRVLRRLDIPASPFYRNDIGTRLRSDLPAIQAHDYAMGMEY